MTARVHARRTDNKDVPTERVGKDGVGAGCSSRFWSACVFPNEPVSGLHVHDFSENDRCFYENRSKNKIRYQLNANCRALFSFSDQTCPVVLLRVRTSVGSSTAVLLFVSRVRSTITEFVTRLLHIPRRCRFLYVYTLPSIRSFGGRPFKRPPTN